MAIKFISTFVLILFGMLLGQAREREKSKEQKKRAERVLGFYDEALKEVREERDTLLYNFINYVSSGVQNPAPYCANRTPDCVDCYGWCARGYEGCRGFIPKTKEEEDHE